MNLLAGMRQRQTPWTRRVLGLFVVVWLNLALQPCAMAFDDIYLHDTEHCQPDTGDAAQAPGNHGPANDSLSATPCNVTGAQCVFLDDYDHDGRTVQLKVKHASNDAPVAIAPSVATLTRLDNTPLSCGLDGPARRPGFHPPLNLLFCVYQI